MIRMMQRGQSPMLEGIDQKELEKAIDVFIERCYKEKGYNKQSLYNDIVRHLRGNPNPHITTCISFVELEVLPLVLKRLEEKY